MEQLQAWWRFRGRLPRFGIVTIAVLLPVSLAAALLVSSRMGSAQTSVVITAASTPPSADAAAQPAAATRAAETGRCDPGKVVRTVAELTANCGDAPDATMGRFRIPSIGVNAPLGQRFVGADGIMPLPSGPADVVWYDMSAWPGLGGAPGAGGNAIFAGHVDYADPVPYAKVDYRGRGVFYSLPLLSQGDVIQVEVGGTTLRYSVTWRKNVSATGGDWAAIMSGNLGTDSITLFTCGGEFDVKTREYSERLVVRAVRS